MAVGNAVVAQSDAQGAWPSLYAATMPDVRGDDYWGPSLFEVRGTPKRVGRSAAKTSCPRAFKPRHKSTKCFSPPPKFRAELICRIRTNQW